MGILDLQVVKAFVRMCDDGWHQGWHERNGGNLTYRMKPEEVEACKPYLAPAGGWVDMGVKAENLAGEYFITTGSGKYFRNVILDPEDNIGIVEINEDGTAWKKMWGLRGGGVPTSEFAPHFMNHSVRKAATGGENRVIYHSHPGNTIALSFVIPPTASAFSQALWRTATECPVVFPHGVGVVEWMVPGGAEIAHATSRLMREYEAVVWAQHGLFCAGKDFDTAFGLMHTVEKAADIYIKILSTGRPILQDIQDDGLRAIARHFKVELNESLLKN